MARIKDFIYLFKAFFFSVEGQIIFLLLYSLLHDLY